MEQLLNDNLAIAATRKFTNHELRIMRKTVNDAIFSRINRRQYIMDRNISKVMTKRLENAIADAGLSDILGQDIWCYYCERFVGENHKNPDKDGPSMKYPARIGIGFRYGEIITAKKYVGDDYLKELDNFYRLDIKNKHGYYQISILPPAHHVEDPPYETINSSWKIIKCAKIKWILGQLHVSRKQQCGIPNCIIKSLLATTDARKRIYGVPLLKAIVDFYITQGMAATLMGECHSIYLKYQQYFIAGAQSATMCFLMIGKFYPRALSGLSDDEQTNWNCYIPMDVIRLIAKHVWDSRYDNKIWGTDTEKILAIPQQFDAAQQSSVYYDEDHYGQSDYQGPHGWVPWLKPRPRRDRRGLEIIEDE